MYLSIKEAYNIGKGLCESKTKYVVKRQRGGIRTVDVKKAGYELLCIYLLDKNDYVATVRDKANSRKKILEGVHAKSLYEMAARIH